MFRLHQNLSVIKQSNLCVRKWKIFTCQRGTRRMQKNRKRNPMRRALIRSKNLLLGEDSDAAIMQSPRAAHPRTTAKKMHLDWEQRAIMQATPPSSMHVMHLLVCINTHVRCRTMTAVPAGATHKRTNGYEKRNRKEKQHQKSAQSFYSLLCSVFDVSKNRRGEEKEGKCITALCMQAHTESD